MAWLIRKKTSKTESLAKDSVTFVDLKSVSQAWRSDNYLTASEHISKLGQKLGPLEEINSMDMLVFVVNLLK